MSLLKKDPLLHVKDDILAQVREMLAVSRDNIVRVTVPVSDALCLKNFLPCSLFPKMYWKDREDHMESCAFGYVLHKQSENPLKREQVIESLSKKLLGLDPHIRFYGGFQFSTHQNPEDPWMSFESVQFVLPRWEFLRDGNGTHLACHLLPHEGPEMMGVLLEDLEQLLYEDEEKNFVPVLVERKDSPDLAQWCDAVETVKKALNQRQVRKVVLARESHLKFRRPVDPWAWLEKITAKTPECFHFAFAWTEEAVFIGASPERLYARQGRHLQTEALAGTRPRRSDEKDDLRLSMELLSSDKERHEHALVVQGIEAALKDIATHVQINKDVSLLKLSRGQHLFSEIQAKLKEGVKELELLKALHPTPAVGGVPTEKALEFIQALEPFSRGWYAAPVGWLHAQGAEFAVAIRSALVCGNALHVYAGAGIVEGSQAHQEWDEIENKMANFFDEL